jgi:hypothetical protein
MRFIKLALLSFIFLFGMITLISLLIPSHIRISKAIDLDSEPGSVLSLVADKNKWPLWHPACEQVNDSLRKGCLQETSWKKLVQNDSLVVIELQPTGKKPILSGWQVYRHKNSGTLTLQWYMDFRLSWYPWEKFSSLFYEGIYGNMMEKGLNNIKDVLEIKG